MTCPHCGATLVAGAGARTYLRARRPMLHYERGKIVLQATCLQCRRQLVITDLAAEMEALARAVASTSTIT